MKLYELQEALTQLDQVKFVLPDRTIVPPHFHITEIGSVVKKYIDCGGAKREETSISLQLFTADDYDHRLSVKKLSGILRLSIDQLNLDNQEVEVEYQGDTIGRYHVQFDGRVFRLIPMQTDCLAKDKCGIPTEKPRVRLSGLGSRTSVDVCAPDSGCC